MGKKVIVSINLYIYAVLAKIRHTIVCRVLVD